jgi:exonuclease VII small subunit
MKFNLEVTIDEVVEQLTHGILTYDEVFLSCDRGTGDTLIKQGGDEVLLSLEQGEVLYKHLQSVFGE